MPQKPLHEVRVLRNSPQSFSSPPTTPLCIFLALVYLIWVSCHQCNSWRVHSRPDSDDYKFIMATSEFNIWLKHNNKSNARWVKQYILGAYLLQVTMPNFRENEGGLDVKILRMRQIPHLNGISLYLHNLNTWSTGLFGIQTSPVSKSLNGSQKW
jgi:hypothetical protein